MKPILMAIVLAALGMTTGEAPPVSRYAPADALAAQIDRYSKRLATALADKSDYGLASRSRVKKDSALLVLLLRDLARHDQPHRLKAHARAALPEAQQLTRSFDDYSQAQPAYLRLRAQLAAADAPSRPLAEVDPLDVRALMRHTGTIHNRLVRELRTLEKAENREEIAAEATALAVLAEALRTTEAKEESAHEDPQWKSYCAAMRDGAAGVASGIRSGDKDETGKAARLLRKSCSDCHSSFRR